MKRVIHAVPLLLALAAACQDQSAVPTATRPLFAAAGPPCPSTATVTVTVSDDAGLRAAIAAAAPGSVIAIQGMIGLTRDETFRTAGIRLTCATTGSGLFPVPGGAFTDMLPSASPKLA